MANSKQGSNKLHQSYTGYPAIYTEDKGFQSIPDDDVNLSAVCNATKEDVIQLRNMISEILVKITDMSKKLDEFERKTDDSLGDVKRQGISIPSGASKSVKDRSTQTGPDLKCIQRQMTEEEDKTNRCNLVFAGVPGK